MTRAPCIVVLSLDNVNWLRRGFQISLSFGLFYLILSLF